MEEVKEFMYFGTVMQTWIDGRRNRVVKGYSVKDHWQGLWKGDCVHGNTEVRQLYSLANVDAQIKDLDVGLGRKSVYFQNELFEGRIWSDKCGG